MRLHEATGKLERPRFLTQGPTAPWADVDVFIAADRAAWEERPLQSVPAARAHRVRRRRRSAVGRVDQSARRLAPVRPRAPTSWSTGIFTARCLFVGAAAPGITDITPYWRPASWAAGVVVVDALSWGEADEGLIDRWNALPEWPQMLLRALMFRLAVHALHPRSTAAAFPGLARTAALVRLMLYGRRIGKSWRTSLSGILPSIGKNPFRAQQFQLPGGQMLCRAARRGDHPVPGQVGGVGAHDPSDDPRAGKPCDSGNVAIGRDPAGRDRGHQRAHPLDLIVGHRRHGQRAIRSRISAATSAGFGLGHHVVAFERQRLEIGSQPLAQIARRVGR